MLDMLAAEVNASSSSKINFVNHGHGGNQKKRVGGKIEPVAEVTSDDSF